MQMTSVSYEEHVDQHENSSWQPYEALKTALGPSGKVFASRAAYWRSLPAFIRLINRNNNNNNNNNDDNTNTNTNTNTTTTNNDDDDDNDDDNNNNNNNNCIQMSS